MILLAVSGGIDSMYMAYKAIEQSRDFAVAHCNFTLREEESDGDERFVQDWCLEHGVRFFSRRFDTSAYAAEHGISIEMAARELRYGWFAELCQEKGFDAVAVAHNANDNAETLMLNLLRGTGSRGLRGMGAVSDREEGLTILRPLLSITREEIKTWMLENGHGWREDRTNAMSEYKRNKIRNEVFPVFAQINPSFIQTLNRDMEHFTEADSIVEDYFLECLSGLDCGEKLENGLSIPRLMALKHWKYILWRILEPYRLSRETFDKLTALLESGRTVSGKVFQSPTHLIEIHKKRIYASPR